MVDNRDDDVARRSRAMHKGVGNSYSDVDYFQDVGGSDGQNARRPMVYVVYWRCGRAEDDDCDGVYSILCDVEGLTANDTLCVR